MSMTREEIIRCLKEILITSDPGNTERANAANESTNLHTELGLNSIGMLYIVIAIEETFGISFDDVGVSDFETLGNVVDYIEAHQK